MTKKANIKGKFLTKRVDMCDYGHFCEKGKRNERNKVLKPAASHFVFKKHFKYRLMHYVMTFELQFLSHLFTNLP